MEIDEKQIKDLFEKSILLAIKLSDAIPDETEPVISGLAASHMSSLFAIAVGMSLERYLSSCTFVYEYNKSKML